MSRLLIGKEWPQYLIKLKPELFGKRCEQQVMSKRPVGFSQTVFTTIQKTRFGLQLSRQFSSSETDKVAVPHVGGRVTLSVLTSAALAARETFGLTPHVFMLR